MDWIEANAWDNAVRLLEGKDEELEALDPTAYCKDHNCQPHQTMAEAVDAHERIKCGG